MMWLSTIVPAGSPKNDTLNAALQEEIKWQSI